MNGELVTNTMAKFDARIDKEYEKPMIRGFSVLKNKDRAPVLSPKVNYLRCRGECTCRCCK